MRLSETKHATSTLNLRLESFLAGCASKSKKNSRLTVGWWGASIVCGFNYHRTKCWTFFSPPWEMRCDLVLRIFNIHTTHSTSAALSHRTRFSIRHVWQDSEQLCDLLVVPFHPPHDNNVATCSSHVDFVGRNSLLRADFSSPTDLSPQLSSLQIENATKKKFRSPLASRGWRNSDNIAKARLFMYWFYGNCVNESKSQILCNGKSPSIEANESLTETRFSPSLDHSWSHIKNANEKCARMAHGALGQTWESNMTARCDVIQWLAESYVKQT